MKTSLHCTITTLLILNPSLGQEYTYSPTYSQTSLASNAHVHTIAPTGGGLPARVPRPTPVPGSDADTYWPTSDAAFLDIDMQIVTANTPVPTAVRVEGETPVNMEATDGGEVMKESIESDQNESDVVAAPESNVDEPPNKVRIKSGVLHTCLLGVVTWLAML